MKAIGYIRVSTNEQDTKNQPIYLVEIFLSTCELPLSLPV